jgi:hypothetical protein
MVIWWSIINSVAPITTSPSLAVNLIDLVKSENTIEAVVVAFAKCLLRNNVVFLLMVVDEEEEEENVANQMKRKTTFVMFDIVVVMLAPRVVGISILWHSWTTCQWNRPVPPLHS